jgi:hypothetical protein
MASATHTPRTIYYYQTPTSLTPLIHATIPNLTLIVSSLHFGYDVQTNEPYIHLNNYVPTDPRFTCMWDQIWRLKNETNAQIHVMLGGAGGAYHDLFSNYTPFYSLLRQFLKSKELLITGINFDVEEHCTIPEMNRLFTDVRTDFPHLELSVAPVDDEVLHPTQPGTFSGFPYQTLFDRWGSELAYVNVQMYNGCFTLDQLQQIIKVWTLPQDKLITGVLSGDYPGQKINDMFNELEDIKLTYPTIGGAFIWEYCNAPPQAPQDPSVWGQTVSKILK